jgi:hypothetical protein
MTEVQWEEPTFNANGTAVGRPRIYEALLTPLMEHPKRWARIRTFPTSKSARTSAWHLAKRRYFVPPGKWEFVGRTVDGKGALYARYMGEL